MPGAIVGAMATNTASRAPTPPGTGTARNPASHAAAAAARTPPDGGRGVAAGEDAPYRHRRRLGDARRNRRGEGDDHRLADADATRDRDGQEPGQPRGRRRGDDADERRVGVEGAGDGPGRGADAEP